MAVFGPLIQAAARARAKMASEARAGAAEAGKTYRDAPSHAKKAADESASAAEKGAEREIAARKRAAAEQKRIMSAMQAQQIRGYRDEIRAADDAIKKRAQYNQQQARSVIGGAAGNVAGIVRAGASVAGRIAAGAGVNLDIGHHVGNVVENESKAVGILNQVKLAGQQAPEGGKAGLLAYAQKTGNETGQSTGSVLDALGEFQAKSSDLVTGQKVMGELGKLALAASADFKEVGAGAAFINAQLEDTPDRADKLLAIMRAITAQTAQGQIELKDWAKYMPRIAAAANEFSGDYSKNIGMLSALAQISVKGGRSTAAEASGSAAALGRDLKKQNTLKAFGGGAGAGKIDIFTGKGNKELRPIEDIIFDSIEKTKGDKAKLARLWKNVNSAAPVMALANIYNRAGGGAKGMAAARAELKGYDKSISKDDVDSMAGDAMKTSKAKMALFNNQLEKIAADTLPKLVPAFERLAPLIVQAADGFAGIVSWTATNPGKAIALAITGSVAKEMAAAGLSKLFSGFLQSAFSGGMGGALGITLSIAAATIAIEEAMLTIKEKAEEKTQEALNTTGNDLSDLRAMRERGEYDPATVAKVQQDRDALASRVANAHDEAPSFLDKINPGKALFGTDFGSGVLNFASAGSYGTSFEQQAAGNSDRAQIGELKEKLDASNLALKNVSTALTSGTLKVHVTNPQGGGPGAAPSSRTGPEPVR